jgi:hypothetical protein
VKEPATKPERGGTPEVDGDVVVSELMVPPNPKSIPKTTRKGTEPDLLACEAVHTPVTAERLHPARGEWPRRDDHGQF